MKGGEKMNYPKKRYSGESPWMNKDWLFNQYITLDKSTQQIADEYGCKRSTLQKHLLNHEIKKDNVKRTHKIKHLYQEKDFLYSHHIDQNLTMTEIAKIAGCSGDTIRNYLLKYDIPIHHEKPRGNIEDFDIKHLYCEEGLSVYSIGKLTGCGDKTIVSRLTKMGVKIRDLSYAQLNRFDKELNPLLLDKEWLSENYIDKNISAQEIGEQLNHAPRTIRRFLKKNNIKLRDNAESKIGLMTGDSHWNWQDGKSSLNALCREYYNTNIARLASKRDKYTCQLCGKTHTILHVHHDKYSFKEIIDRILLENSDLSISKNKEQLYEIIIHDEVFNDIDNLITYCRDCHWFKIHKYKRRSLAAKP